MPDYRACDLSKYGYDVAVATTQSALNSTLLWFLETHKQPEFIRCWVETESGKQEISYDYLVSKTGIKDLDIFSIPHNTSVETDERLKKLYDANFYAAFKATLGVPPMSDPSKTPDLINVTDSVSSIYFNLLCSHFQVVELDTGTPKFPKLRWKSYTQEKDKPWIGRSLVQLREKSIAHSAWSELTEDQKKASVGRQVREKANELVDNGMEFSIEILLMDVSDAKVMSWPVFEGPSDDARSTINTWFVESYFSQMQKRGDPLLMVALPQPKGPSSTFIINSVRKRMYPPVTDDGAGIANPTPEQRRRATLNCLCITSPSRELPKEPVSAFQWEWVPEKQLSNYDGVIAIQGLRFFEYLAEELRPIVKTRCVPTYSKCWDGDFLWRHVWFKTWIGEPVEPTCTYVGENSIRPPPGSDGKDPSHWPRVIMFKYDHESDRKEGTHGFDFEHIYFDNHYKMEVRVWDHSIQIEEHIRFWINFKNGLSEDPGNVVDRKVTTLYDFVTNQQGELRIVRRDKPEVVNGPIIDSTGTLNEYFGLASVHKKVESISSDLTNLLSEGVDITSLRGFVFPGRRTFSFKRAAFSTVGLDLVGEITYNV